MSDISERVKRQVKLMRESRVAPIALPADEGQVRDTPIPQELEQAIKDRMANRTDSEAFYKAFWKSFGKKYRKD